MFPKIVAIVALFFIFTFSGSVLAEGENPHGNGHGENQNQMQMQMQDSDMMQDMTTEEHQNMMNHDMGGSDQTSEGHGAGHGMEKEYVETPPNWPVLGAFAAINLIFIMIGIWNKWFSRKEVV